MAFSAFLDACVLVPINLADVLLRLAGSHTYRPLWSPDVLAEVERNIPRASSRVTPEKAAKRVEVMRRHFLDAMVTGYEPMVPRMPCDPKDRHVLAAAVRANAEVIVTANTKDFPSTALAKYAVQAIHPDDFLLDQLDLYTAETVGCVVDLVAVRRRPAETLESFLTQLAKTVPGFSKQVLTAARRSLPS
ncbi:PIN domain-containing protein [Amycolatopsis nigrescens]|uniref:PIN domain-containing protein n=1 Tax=Amycolatopsis nigrescens TaxID=381445 RepID=UPI000361FCD5|nr:PIN domain-containing protein [Amycolatopsis nigrescens]